MGQNPVSRIDKLPDVSIRPDYFGSKTITIGPCDGSSVLKKEIRLAYIIDGELRKGDFPSINYKSIARIEVLHDPKDANRTDLPENITGVVLITTKNKR